MVDTRTIKKLEERLNQEAAVLEIELADIGKLDPSNPRNWDGTKGNLETGTADASILADRFEESSTNNSIVTELEGRLNSIKDALVRIKDGIYGECSECGEKIPLPRLEANPAAATCVIHTD